MTQFVYTNVNEEAEIYHASDNAQDALDLLEQFPNDLIIITTGDTTPSIETVVEALQGSRSVHSVLASRVQEGDYIVNVGVVNAPPKVDGVFVSVETFGTVWSTFTGKGEQQVRTTVWHETEEISVES